MGRVILVQHCQSEHHVNEMSGGWTDTPLTELGRRQAQLTAHKLKDIITRDEYVLYSSDLLRASQTAQIIGKHLGLEATPNPGLREINTGVATGKTKEWARSHRDPRTGGGFDLDHQQYQNAETWRQFYRRVSDCMDSLGASDESNHLLVVTHGGTVSQITAWWLRFSEQMLATAYFSASPGSISVLTHNSFHQNVLAVFNDTSHLSLLG